jgi:ABC-type transport system substrate-binding protein
MGYQLNSYRALFRNNAKLRRAVNFAVDRRALVRGMSGRATDQYLPPGIPGFRDARIYPLAGPNVRRAQALARGHIRSGKAVMFTIDVPAELARAQILKRNLKAIGLDVEVKAFPGPAFFRMLSMRDARFDIAPFGWAPDYIDPYQYTNALFDSRIGGGTLTRFHSPRFNRLLRRTARRQGKARYRAYGKLDVTLARDAAPMVAVAYQNDLTFVSKRVGCIVLRPTLDLTAACLK